MTTWNPGINSMCALCQDIAESRSHLFFSSTFSAEVCSLRSFYPSKIFDILGYISISHLRQSIRANSPFLARYVFQTIKENFCKTRNARRHGEIYTTSITLIDKQIRNQLSSIKAQGDHIYEV